MKRFSIPALIILWGVAMPPADAAAAQAKDYPNVKPFGYIQYTGHSGAGSTAHRFGFDRVRLGVKGDVAPRIGYRAMIELLKLNQPAKADTTVEGLLDAELSFTLLPQLKISAGQFKTPFSMDYSTPASKLDVIGFGMATNVSLDRGLGMMLSGRDVALRGLGYDVGVFNAGTRADATAYTAGTLGRDDTVVGRLLYDGMHGAVHVEAGGAHSGVKNGSAYRAAYAGLRLRYAPLEVKAEYLQGKQGLRRTTVVYGQLLAGFLGNYEAVGKWERTRYTNAATKLTADNLTLGINAALYPDKPKRVRLQLDYVIAYRDARSLGTQVGFKKGVRDNQVALLLQAGF
jgi:Phosphate-selective porin O and P